jgi:hypothetical protein
MKIVQFRNSACPEPCIQRSLTTVISGDLTYSIDLTVVAKPLRARAQGLPPAEQGPEPSARSSEDS